MPAAGGPARRMTWLGPDVMVRGFTPDGRILFVTTYGQPFFRNYRAYTLDPAGGMPQLLPLRPGQSPRVRTRQARGSSAATPPIPARWKRYRGGTAGHLWIDAAGTRRLPPHDRARGQPHQPDVDRRPDLLPVRRRGRRQPLFVPARRRPTCAATPTTTTTTRGTRRPTAGASSTSAAPTSGCSIRRPTARARVDIETPRASHAGRAPFRAGRRAPGRRPRAPGRPQPGGRRARQALHVRAVGGRGPPARRSRRRPLPARRSGWPTARRWSASATRRARSASVVFAAGRRARAAVGRRPRRRAARRAARGAGRDRQPPQRGAGRRPRQRRADRGRSQRRGRTDDLAWSPDGALARLFVLDQPRALRDQAARRRQRQQHAGHAARVPRLLPGVRSRRPLPVLPVDAHVRPGLRHRAVRAELPARGAALPDRAAGRRPAAVRARAQGPGRERRGGRRATSEGEGRSRGAGAARRPRRHRAAASRRSRWPRAASARSPAPPGGKVVWTVLPIAGAHGRGGHKEGPGRLEVFDFATLRAETLLDKADGFALAADHATLRRARRQAPARHRGRPQARRRPRSG